MEPLDLTLYREALIVLGAAAVVVPLVHRLRISPVLGFILAGLVVGPFAAGALSSHVPWLGTVTIVDPDDVGPIGQLGVVMLMFMIGLELSFERLWTMRRLVFGLGALQLVLCAGAIAGMAIVLGQTTQVGIVIGLSLAMSSTALVIQVLSDEKRLNSAVGRTGFAVLLFQDLAVVPVLFALGALGPGPHGSPASLAVAIGHAVAAVVVIIAVGRLILRPLFRSVARTRSAESFVAASLLVVIATGLATEAAGLSMALGALIGGLLLAGTEYRRQVEVTIDPFKGLFLGVFLVSIGMNLDLRVLAAHPAMVVGIASGLVLLKLLVIAPIARLFGLSWTNALQTGLLLGPGGEFSFVIVALAVAQSLLPTQVASLVLIVAALTMGSIPLLSRLGLAVSRRVAPPPPADPSLLAPELTDAVQRVIVAGFGRVGQTVVAMLEVHGIAYVAIDRDPDRVARQRRLGKSVYYGDTTSMELLHRVHLETAPALVVTLDDPRSVDALVAGARKARPDLLIIARARDAGHAAQLYRTGASDAVPETIEASLQLSEAVLVDIGVPMGPVIASVHEKRAELQAAIKEMAPGADVRMFGRRRLHDALE